MPGFTSGGQLVTGERWRDGTLAATTVPTAAAAANAAPVVDTAVAQHEGQPQHQQQNQQRPRSSHGRKWIVSCQGYGGKKASCNECHVPMQSGEVRAATAANHSSRRGYCHWECCLQQMRASDEVTAEHEAPDVLEAVEALKQQVATAAGADSADAPMWPVHHSQTMANHEETRLTGVDADLPSLTSAWPCPNLEWWDGIDVMQMLQRPASLVAKVPESLLAQYRAAKLVLLEALDAAIDEQSEMRAWKAVVFLDRMLLWKGQQRGGKGRNGKRVNANVRTITERLTWFWSGQWSTMWAALQDTARPQKRRSDNLSPQRIEELVEDGAWRKLLTSLRGGAPLVSNSNAVPELQSLLNDNSTSIPPQQDPPAVDVSLEKFTAALRAELKDASPHAAGGRDGGRAAHWQVGSGDERYEKLLGAALFRWVEGKRPKSLTTFWQCKPYLLPRKTMAVLGPLLLELFFGDWL